MGVFEMKILTFVIPAYNSEAFLDKCISSMLVPELLEKLEILVVNDGSTDTTADIAQSYCIRYPDTVRLISQENKGHGGALNTGCASAAGRYIKVIDADDWVLSASLPAFVQALERCDSDVVLTHHHAIDISTGEVKNWRSYPEVFGKPYTFQQILSDWRSFDRSLTFHGITYRREFYHSHSQPLLEHVFYEDHQYATFPCCYAQSVTCLDLFVYEYRIGDVHQSVSSANQLKRIGHTEQVIHRMMAQYLTLPECSGKHYAAMKIQGLVLSYLTTMLLVNPDRKDGRRQAAKLMHNCKTQTPEVYQLAKAKYCVFYLMNWGHIRINAWQKIVSSKFYNFLRKNHTFT